MPGDLIYCSGPMFSPGDMYDQQQVATALESAGYTTYLPQRDGIEIGKIMALLKNPIVEATFFTKLVTLVQKAGFSMDIYQLVENSRAVVFNMDGRVPDEGSVVEATIAYMTGLPLVIYKDTPITAMGNFDNCMLTGLSTTWQYAETYDAIPPALKARLADPTNAGYTLTPPPHVAAVCDAGKKVQDLHDTIKQITAAGLSGPELLKALAELVAALEAIWKS